MRYNVKVNLNELAWKEEQRYRDCLSELEEMAAASPGFVQGWTSAILPPYLHFVGNFDTLHHAQRYQATLLEKDYIGRVAIEREGGPRVMEQHFLWETSRS